MNVMKKIYHNLLLVPGLPSLFRFAQRNCATVFMLHRFTHRDRGIVGLDPSLLRRGLEYLRRNDYELISLTGLFHSLNNDSGGLNGAVVFTIDDGYIDHAEVAAPIFAEFDCPVTTFVTTGFLDRKLWMWWDKIEFVFLTTTQTSIEVNVEGASFSYFLHGDGNDLAAQEDFVERCKRLDDDEKHKAIASLADRAEVDLPSAPPVIFSPMTWDNARSCEKTGMTFGPHTVTHPVLSRTTSEQAEWEISESWYRLCAEVENPTPVFCYPNGRSSDFGVREIEIIRRLGLTGAVVGVPGFAEPVNGNDKGWLYEVCRMSYPDTTSDVIQYVSGVERCKQLIRSHL